MDTVYTHHIDLNERGMFYAHVENSRGNIIFSYSNEQIDFDDDGNEFTYNGDIDLIQDGYMDDVEDMDGLKSYLVEIMGIMKASYRLVDKH